MKSFKVNDPYYTLDLTFEDRQGETYRVTKGAAPTVYKKYQDGGPIEISYVTSNPYHVFVRDYSVGNLIDTLLYMKWPPNQGEFYPFMLYEDRWKKEVAIKITAKT